MSTEDSARSEILIKQGAEALAYKSVYLESLPALRKHRPQKQYRHPILDAKITKHRILAEARLLQKCRKSGLPVPALYFIDEQKGDLWIEWIEGRSVRDVLNDQDPRKGGSKDKEIDENNMMREIGKSIARLHLIDVVHGDLTTSNLLLREPPRTPEPLPALVSESQLGEVVLIDFGLGVVSLSEEDKAVDLYVLERAFISTHPGSEPLFESVLRAYGESGKKAKSVLKKLEDVRMRGRKRSMLG